MRNGIFFTVAQTLLGELAVEMERVVLATGKESFVDYFPFLGGHALRLIEKVIDHIKYLNMHSFTNKAIKLRTSLANNQNALAFTPSAPYFRFLSSIHWASAQNSSADFTKL